MAESDLSQHPFVRSMLGSTIAERYELSRLIGRGGTGWVFEGKHTWTDRAVAVKVLAVPAGDGGSTLAKRFLREAKAAAKLPHRNVVDVLDMGETGGLPFIVLELLEGEPLDALLERESTLSLERTLQILLPVLDALAAAHTLSMVHRDVKAENIFLHRDDAGVELPKILDFGTVATGYSEGETPLTGQGALLGTPHYMSPEQVMGRPVEAASDTWACGILAFRMLSGRFPFVASNPTMVLADVATKPVPSVSEAVPGLAPGAASAIQRALRKAPAERHESMHAFLDALVAGAREVGLTPWDPRDRASEPGR